jgi:site-specific recombinase XerD
MAIRPLNEKRTKWQIDYHEPGKPRGTGRKRITFDGSETEALQLEMAVRRKYLKALPLNPLIRQVLPDFEKHIEDNMTKKTVIDMKRVLRKMNFFLSIRFTMLTVQKFDDYKNMRLKDGVTKRTINKEVSYISSLITWAAKRNICNKLPFEITHMSNADSPDPDILNWDEVDKLVNASEPLYRGMILLLTDQGLRKDEALTLTAERVDLELNTIKIKGKNGKDETIPIITGRLRAELTQAKSKVGEKGYLFVNPMTGKPFNTIRKVLLRAAGVAEIKKRVYAHQLRHCFGTFAVQSGIDIVVLQKLMRHMNIKTTLRYVQISNEHKKAAGKKLAAIFERERGPMQKVVGKKRYDTEKAQLIGTRCNSFMPSEESYIKEELYQTQNGNWFICGEGGSHTPYSNNGHLGRDIVPLSADDAQAWLEKYSDVSLVERYFGDSIEDA